MTAARGLLFRTPVRSRDLRQLARLYSMQLAYDDASGKRQKASKKSLQAVLERRTPEGQSLTDALQSRQAAFWKTPVDPVIVVWGRQRPMFELRLPKATQGSVDWIIELEGGGERSGKSSLDSSPPHWTEESYTGRTVVLREPLPHGYHRLRLQAGGRQAESLIIAAPQQAPSLPRSWGVFMPLYAARMEKEPAPGHLGTMRSFRRWINDLGGGVVATLPLLATFDDEWSPYSPVSRLFWNENYLDARQVPEWREGDERLGSKRAILERMASRFEPDGEFEAFRRKASDYAQFRARAEGKESQQYHLYVQYRMAGQMRQTADEARSNGPGLYLDFPLGVNPNGYDAWKYAHLFARGISVGAPPDSFFTKGQNWGFPPFDPDAIRMDGYQYFRECLRHHLSHAGILRIDHVMGLHRLFWIPEGMEARDGLYVRYREEEMYAVLILEASRHRCAVVGEDLGTVPEYVPRMMKKHGLRSMYVVQYEIKREGQEVIGTPPQKSVASINTHDMPTFAGFWNGKDIEDRLAQELLDGKGAEEERSKREQMRSALRKMLEARGLLLSKDGDTKAILEALLRYLSESPAEIVLVNLEDLWLEEEPQNVPGVPERSWKGRFRLTLEEMRRHPGIAGLLRDLNERRRKLDGHAKERTPEQPGRTGKHQAGGPPR